MFPLRSEPERDGEPKPQIGASLGGGIHSAHEALENAKTGFDRSFAERMKDRELAAATEARAGIDSVDAFVRSLDEVRSKAGVSKALLAKRTGTQPAAMRRLLTMDAPNPTLATVMSIVRSLGYSLALVPAQGRAKRGKARKPTVAPAATA